MYAFVVSRLAAALPLLFPVSKPACQVIGRTCASSQPVYPSASALDMPVPKLGTRFFHTC